MNRMPFVSVVVSSFLAMLTVHGAPSPVRAEDAPAAGTRAHVESEPDHELREVGRRRFQNTCSPCHGPAAEGRIGPSLRQVTTRLTDPEVRRVLRHGRRGMPSFADLPERDVDGVVAFLHALAVEPLPASAVTTETPTGCCGGGGGCGVSEATTDQDRTLAAGGCGRRPQRGCGGCSQTQEAAAPAAPEAERVVAPAAPDPQTAQPVAPEGQVQAPPQRPAGGRRRRGCGGCRRSS